jgi:low affinity Fe/Cu permease
MRSAPLKSVPPKSVKGRFEHAAHFVAEQSGRPWAFALAALGIVVWLVTGPLFGFSDTWQLVVNTATTIITFLMVFLIQQAQNKEARAMELKLDELISAIDAASNRLLDVEDLSEDELIALRHRYDRLVERAPPADDR